MTTKTIQDVVEAIDRTYEDERDKFDREFRKQMTQNTLTQLVKEVEAGERERLYKKVKAIIEDEEHKGVANFIKRCLDKILEALTTPPTSDVTEK